jgi:hypothetical protein
LGVSLHQVLTVVHDLETAGVVKRYAIGGAVGATRYLAAMSTEDVDVFVEAIAAAVDVDVDGVPTRIFTAEHLTAIALQVGRAKDKLRVVQMVEAKVLDMPRFETILDRYGLKTKWKELSRGLLGEQ